MPIRRFLVTCAAFAAWAWSSSPLLAQKPERPERPTRPERPDGKGDDRRQRPDPRKGAPKADAAEVGKANAAKRAAPFVAKAGFQTSWDAAATDARKRGVPVLAYVTRALPQNPACEAVETGLLVEDGFAAMAKECALYLHVAAGGTESRPSPTLMKFEGRTLPAFVFADADGSILATATASTLDAVAAAKAEAFAALQRDAETRKKAAAGDPAAQAALLEADLKKGALDVDEARRAFAALGAVDAATKARLEDEIVALEVRQIMAKVRSSTDVGAAGTSFRAMLEAGRVPKGPTAVTFFNVLFNDAERRRDLDQAQRSLDGLKAAQGDDQRLAPLLKTFEARLEKLKQTPETRRASR